MHPKHIKQAVVKRVEALRSTGYSARKAIRIAAMKQGVPYGTAEGWIWRRRRSAGKKGNNGAPQEQGDKLQGLGDTAKWVALAEQLNKVKRLFEIHAPGPGTLEQEARLAILRGYWNLQTVIIETTGLDILSD